MPLIGGSMPCAGLDRVGLYDDSAYIALFALVSAVENGLLCTPAPTSAAVSVHYYKTWVS